MFKEPSASQSVYIRPNRANSILRNGSFYNKITSSRVCNTEVDDDTESELLGNQVKYGEL